MNNAENKKCGLYKPGHNTHFVQANVMRDKARYPATFDLISPFSMRIKTELQDEVLFFHDALGLFFTCSQAIDGDVQYSPESQLLYVKTDGPTETTKGAWFLAYLCKNELTECAELDQESGYYSVGEA